MKRRARVRVRVRAFSVKAEFEWLGLSHLLAKFAGIAYCKKEERNRETGIGKIENFEI